MPQFFSPKRNFTESKYNKIQILINKFFKLDKRKSFKNRIASDHFSKNFTFRPKTNNNINPRIKITKAKTRLISRTQVATPNESSSQKHNSAISQGKINLVTYFISIWFILNIKTKKN